MVAGGVAVPYIAPRQQIGKGIIDTNTIVDMTCPNYTNALIFYTTDGSKPTSRVSRTINTRTHKYDGTGILLRQGKRIVRALSVLLDGRESNVISKEYLVQWAPSESDEESDSEIYKAINQSRDARSGSASVTSAGAFAETNRTVGNDVICRRLQSGSGQRLPTTNTVTTTHPRVISDTKMNATSGPVAGRFDTAYGASQFDLPPQPRLNGNLLRCTGCGRVNNPDARFCDWCGTLPGGQGTWETVPFPMRPREKPKQPKRSIQTLVSRNAGTQTVGLFYPGAARIQKETTELFDTLQRKDIALEQSKTISAASPGNGKWNQQIEHINAHLKSYTQHNKEFRETVSQPRIGKLASAEVIERDEHVELFLAFPMVDTKGNAIAKRKEKVKKVAFGSTAFEDEKIEKPKKKDSFQLPSEERILLNELSKKKCNLDKIEEMLAAGADPNVANKDGQPALALAIEHGHYEAALQLIGIETFSFHYKGGKDQNTFLHLIVIAGESPETLKILRKMISIGAREKKNGNGRLPSDLARQFRYNAMFNELEGVDGVKSQVRDQPRASSSSRERVSVTQGSETSTVRPKSASSSRERPQSSARSNSPNSARSKSGSTKSATRSSAASARSNPTSARSTGSTKSKHSLLDDF